MVDVSTWTLVAMIGFVLQVRVSIYSWWEMMAGQTKSGKIRPGRRCKGD
jgi:hypothetical protein